MTLELASRCNILQVSSACFVVMENHNHHGVSDIYVHSKQAQFIWSILHVPRPSFGSNRIW